MYRPHFLVRMKSVSLNPIAATLLFLAFGFLGCENLVSPDSQEPTPTASQAYRQLPKFRFSHLPNVNRQNSLLTSSSPGDTSRADLIIGFADSTILPNKLLQQGVRDMVRISDARMSGTSYGMCILHVSPESHVGGPLAFVETGDMIEIDVQARTIHLDVSEDELQKRKDKWVAPEPKYVRGYGQLFSKHVTQAHEGCDFDFLQDRTKTPDPKIH